MKDVCPKSCFTQARLCNGKTKQTLTISNYNILNFDFSLRFGKLLWRTQKIGYIRISLLYLKFNLLTVNVHTIAIISFPLDDIIGTAIVQCSMYNAYKQKVCRVHSLRGTQHNIICTRMLFIRVQKPLKIYYNVKPS